MIKRGNETVIPKGDTILQESDIIVLSNEVDDDPSDLEVQEIVISKNHEWSGHTIATCNIPKDTSIVMIRRKGGNIVPSGDTVIRPDDILLACTLKE